MAVCDCREAVEQGRAGEERKERISNGGRNTSSKRYFFVICHFAPVRDTAAAALPMPRSAAPLQPHTYTDGVSVMRMMRV